MVRAKIRGVRAKIQEKAKGEVKNDKG